MSPILDIIMRETGYEEDEVKGIAKAIEGHIESRSLLIVRDIAADLNDRSGLGLDGIDSETREEIQETWQRIVERHLIEV
jgi:hypothetical protein